MTESDHQYYLSTLALERRRDVLTQLGRHAEAATYEEARAFLQEQINKDLKELP